MARRPLYEKEERRGGKRTVNQTREERDLHYGRLRDYNKGKQVVLFWDFTEQAKEDGILGLKVGAETVFIDAEQLRKFLRWV